MGWSFGWVLITIPLAYWFMVAVLAPRFTAVKELTLPAFLERRYESKVARGIGGVIILIATVVYIQAKSWLEVWLQTLFLVLNPLRE